MSVYDTFETTAELLRAKETFSELDDVELIELKKVQAKEDLKWDLMTATGYDIDNSDMDTYLNTNELFIQELLANKQLSLYFIENYNGAGSQNAEKAKYYEKKYEVKRNQLKSLIEKTIPTTMLLTIRR
jgi:hypothetical protein